MADPTGMDTTAIARFEQFRELLYGHNGRNRMRAYDGVNWSNAGIEQGCPVTEANAQSTADRSPVTPTFNISSPGGAGGVVVTAASRASTVVTLTSPAHGIPVGARVQADLRAAVQITNLVLTSNVVTITTATAHGLSMSSHSLSPLTIEIKSGPALYADVNGTYYLASVPSSTTFTFAKTHADITTGAATGIVTSDTGVLTTPNFFYATSPQSELVTAVTTDTLSYVSNNSGNDVTTVQIGGTVTRLFLHVLKYSRSSNVATVEVNSAEAGYFRFTPGDSVKFHGTSFSYLSGVTATVVSFYTAGSSTFLTFASTGSDVALTTLPTKPGSSDTYVTVDHATTETADVANSIMTGTYRYFIVAANSKKLNAEGRPTEAIPSNISSEISVDGQAVTINNIPATHEDPQVDTFNIYRNKSGVYDTDVLDEQQDFFYIGQVALGTTTYTDSAADDTLTDAERLRFNQNIPPTCRFGAIFGERMFLAGFDPITAGTAGNTFVILEAERASTTAVINSPFHGLKIGDTIIVTITAGPTGFAALNGTWVITGVTTNTITFETTTSGTITNGSATGTLITPLYVYFDAPLPDGVVGCWFKKNGETAVYRIVRQLNAYAVRIAALVFGDQIVDSGHVGGMLASSYTIYRDPWEVYFSEFQDGEAWGPNGEGARYKLTVPGKQAVTGLKAFAGMLLVFTEHAIYAITGKGPNREDVQLRPDPIYNGLGAVSCDAIVQVDNEIHVLTHRGVAVLAGTEPQLIGIPLNTDWLDTLNASEKAIAVMGTDDEDVYLSVPVSGQTLNAKTYRYERQTQSWWEERGMCPTLFVRQDGDNGYTDILYFLQGKSYCRPNRGTYDLVSAEYVNTAAAIPVNGNNISITTGVCEITTDGDHGFLVGETVHVEVVGVITDLPSGDYLITAVGSSTLFSFATTATVPELDGVTVVTLVTKPTARTSIAINTTFPTTNGGLVECLVRFYNAGVLAGVRRIISNTSTTITWSSDATLPYSGTLVVQPAYTYEIGNVCWEWVTKTDEVPGHLKRTMDVNLSFDRSSTASIKKTDIIDGVEETIAPKNIECANQIAYKYAVARANRTYAARFSSRDGAVLRHATLSQQTEAGSV